MILRPVPVASVAYPCPVCGEPVRDIYLTTGRRATITDEPNPRGRITPWPALTPQTPCEGRILDAPIPGEDMWAEHPCPVN